MVNQAENEVKQILNKVGYEALHKGWPDFLVYDEERAFVFCIEVKYGQDTASSEQQIVHAILKAAGIPTLVFYVEYDSDRSIEENLLSQINYMYSRQSSNTNKTLLEEIKKILASHTESISLYKLRRIIKAFYGPMKAGQHKLLDELAIDIGISKKKMHELARILDFY